MSSIVHTSSPLSSFIYIAKHNLSSTPSQYNTCTRTKRCLIVKAIEKSKSKVEAKPRSQEDDYHAILKPLNLKGRKPRKSLGQHYMLSSSINEQLVAAADVKEGDVVLEIGPGIGSLTNVLVESGAIVLAIEKVVSNLQFNISTDVIKLLLPMGDIFSEVVLLLQDTQYSKEMRETDNQHMGRIHVERRYGAQARRR
ncbi:hypothetical protein POM88_033116 [Heracleum sosnowskyi]|uniref:rRNA adenine N(6)-methyltransferase n=1 Tax=Heracleum sosnowskyi TaxID=360622 RepID=A0AAD8MLY4_9APIA|nr:hypothetical protein POM88_033116 [Heracleum sosnowskyi]